MTKIISCAQLDIKDRKHKPPQPKVGDRVERLDMTELFGVVIKIKKPNHVMVSWSRGHSGYKLVKELISDLALVERR